MLFRTHILFGVFCFFVLESVVEMPFFVLFGVLAGCVFVDIDSCSSKVGRRVKFLSWFFRHRGMLHSLVACLVLSCIVGMFSLWFGFGFFVGYFSHLVLDSFNRAGIRLFWPLKFKIKGFIKSGSWVEDVLFVLLLFVDGWLFLISLF